MAAAILPSTDLNPSETAAPGSSSKLLLYAEKIKQPPSAVSIETQEVGCRPVPGPQQSICGHISVCV